MTSPEIVIDHRKISTQQPPYIIAEMSANHNGNLASALKLIEAAKIAGADAVKIQTYTADTITLDCDKQDFLIKDGLWAGQRLYDLYQSAHTPWDWHTELFAYAKKLDITLFSSPFDKTAIDLLENLNTPAYKIASFEAIDLPLIKYAASTKKPMIISTGMANKEEIQEAIAAARDGGCRQLAILHCVSSYPAAAEDYNLHTITDMMERFGVVTGLSDHTLDNTTAITSIALGAAIIEKHFTFNRKGGGPDDSFSLEPSDLTALCRDSKMAWQALGKATYARSESEKGNIKFRRSLYFVEDISAGGIITEKSVKSIRPGYGLAPKYIDQVIGRRAAMDIKRGTAVSLEHLLDTTGL